MERWQGIRVETIILALNDIITTSSYWVGLVYLEDKNGGSYLY